MAKLLLIETATEICGAAISVDGNIVALHETPDSNDHVARLSLQIEACVRDSGLQLKDMDAVAISSGPGSYTSLRVGASVAKGICYPLGKPLIAVETLHSLAWASREALRATNQNVLLESHRYAPMIDARRQEVWWSLFDENLNLLMPATPKIIQNNMFYGAPFEIGAEQLFGEINSRKVRLIFSGNGSKKLKNVLDVQESVFSPVEICSARHLAMLAEKAFQVADFQSLAYFEPVYMKPPNITTPRITQS